MMEILYKNQDSHDRLLRNFSVNELFIVQQSYKDIFKKQLRQPTADNNHIINYNMKMQNYVLMNNTIHFFSAGALVFGISQFMGNTLERVC